MHNRSLDQSLVWYASRDAREKYSVLRWRCQIYRFKKAELLLRQIVIMATIGKKATQDFRNVFDSASQGIFDAVFSGNATIL